MSKNLSSIATFSENILEVVPECMAVLPRWLLWIAEIDPEHPEKKPRKTPIYTNGNKRFTDYVNGTFQNLSFEDDLSKLVTLSEAYQVAKQKNCGIGFAFIESDGFVGIDLDNCIDKETGEFSELAQKICNSSMSYTEISPSWTGLHVITKGVITQGSRCSKIEVYSKDRYFCFTGRHLEEYSNEVKTLENSFFEKLERTIKKFKDGEMKAKTSQTTVSLQNNYKSNDDDFYRDYNLAAEAIPYLSCEEYDSWVRVGMALKSKFGDAGFDLWNRWSMSSSKYRANEMHRKWLSFRRESGGVGIGSVFNDAKSRGWQMPKKKREERKEKESANAQSTEQTTQEQNSNQTQPASDEWPDPVDFLGDILPPSAPLELLPEVLGNYIADQSDMIGSDPGVMVVSCLVACAGAISDSVRISPKRHNAGWTERACLWGAYVGESSGKKSPGATQSFKPLKKIEDNLAEQRKRETEEYNQAMEEFMSSRKSKKTAGTVPKPQKPLKTQYMVGTTTIEALQQISADNARGLLTVYDELQSWFGSMDAYNKSGSSKDRPLWLELYNGGSKMFNTVSRGEIWVKNWSSSIYGGIQPDPMRKIARSLPDDGLLQRFFVVCATQASTVGVDRAPTPGVSKNYHHLFEWLLDISPSRDDEFLELSDGAMAIKNDLYDWARKMINSGAVMGGLASHVGKYEGLYARLLVVWHCVTMFQREKWSWIVDETVASECAKFLKEFLFPHAVYFYHNVLDLNDSISVIKDVGKAILTLSEEKVTNRSLARKSKEWRKMSDAHKMDVMQSLDAYSWIAPLDSANSGRKLPRYWVVNPKLKVNFKAMIDKEKKRIEMAREVMQSLRRKNLT